MAEKAVAIESIKKYRTGVITCIHSVGNYLYFGTRAGKIISLTVTAENKKLSESFKVETVAEYPKEGNEMKSDPIESIQTGKKI